MVNTYRNFIRFPPGESYSKNQLINIKRALLQKAKQDISSVYNSYSVRRMKFYSTNLDYDNVFAVAIRIDFIPKKRG